MQVTKPRPPLQAVSPQLTIVQPLIRPSPTFPAGLPGMVLINARPYQVMPLTGGYAVIKDRETTYHVNAAVTSCDCGDGTFRSDRPGGCIHQHGIRALLGKAQPVQVPAPEPRPIIPASRRFRSTGDLAANAPDEYERLFGGDDGPYAA